MRTKPQIKFEEFRKLIRFKRFRAELRKQVDFINAKEGLLRAIRDYANNSRGRYMFVLVLEELSTAVSKRTIRKHNFALVLEELVEEVNRRTVMKANEKIGNILDIIDVLSYELGGLIGTVNEIISID